jgi:thiazole/oxazole-forming peptide maturase SagD family component
MCMLRAVSEGVERLAARGARAHRVLSRAPAGEPLVRPGQLDSRVARSIDRARRGYCTAYDLTNERWGWIPHEAVVVGLPRGLAGAHTRREPFYTGAASHQTLTAAIVHATREIVQRDAFMVTWYRRRAAPRIAMPADDALTDEARGLLAYVRRVRLKIELFDISTDTPLPILMLRATATRAIGVWPRGGALILATSGFTPMAALERALGLACAQLIPLGIHPHPLKDPLNPAAVRIMQRRTQFWRLMARYLDPARADAHAFLGAGGERPLASMPRFAADTPRGQLALLRRWFRRLDRAWYAVRLTGALASWCGFEVVKVVIPGLVNIAPSRADVDLRGPRLSMEWSDAMSATPHLHSHPLF